jgi:hypothetical protein
MKLSDLMMRAQTSSFKSPKLEGKLKVARLLSRRETIKKTRKSSPKRLVSRIAGNKWLLG